MVNSAMPKKDINQMAANVMALTTGTKLAEESKKNPAAVALGRLGGLKGGKARAESMSASKRKSVAQKAASERWRKYYSENPPKK
jgi:hypothetical protein